jgi:hypothetical protein
MCEPMSSQYYYKELDKKNQYIYELKNRINNLLDEKLSLHNEIENLKNKNFQISQYHNQQNEKFNIQSKTNENKLHETIRNLQLENENIKSLLNKKDDINNNFNSTYYSKLNNYQKEIDNLRILNAVKDNLLIEMENFLNKLNEICGTKLNYILDYSNDDIDIYFRNLKNLEKKIINYCKFEENMSKNPLIENVFHDEENWKNNVIIKNKNNSVKYNSYPPKKIFNDTFQNKNMKKDNEININFDNTLKDRKKHIPTYTKLRNTQRQEIPLRNSGLGAFNRTPPKYKKVVSKN